MPIQAIIWALLFLLTAQYSWAAAETTLLGMTRSQGEAESRIILDFSQPPTYTFHRSGQRLVLVFSNAEASPGLDVLPEDDIIIRTEISASGDTLTLTFLLRRPPRAASASFTLGNTAAAAASGTRLAVNLQWDAAAREVMPAIVGTLPGMPTVGPSEATASRNITSKYTGQWRTFFSDHEFPVSISVPLNYTLPARPVTLLRHADAARRLPAGLFTAVNQADWNSVLSFFADRTAQKNREDGKEDPLLTVLHGEARVRLGNFAAAVDILAPLLRSEPGRPIAESAAYLASYANAADNDPYRGGYRLEMMRKKSGSPSPLTPNLTILAAEIALATGRYDEARQLMTGEETPPAPETRDIYLLRRADAWYAGGRSIKAYALYRQLEGKDALLAEHPFSLAAYADLLYRRGEYPESLKKYERLSRLLAGLQGDLDLVRYRIAMCMLKNDNQPPAVEELRTVMKQFPGTAGYFRARLKINDLAFYQPGQTVDELSAAEEYGVIATTAPERELREEAAFKQALAYYLLEEKMRTVELLQRFLKEHAGGRLTAEARGLQLEVLPATIHQLVEEEEYLQGLVLAEQNRELLLSGRLNTDFLAELGIAFASLLLYNRAARVYRFMLATSRNKAEEEERYLPLIESLYKQEDYTSVEKYAGAYLDHFGTGDDRARVWFLYAKALQKSGKPAEAAKLLSSRNRPATPELDTLAGHIFWELKNYREAARFLDRAQEDDSWPADDADILLRAEAHFLNGQPESASPLFLYLTEKEEHKDQALYRLAQIKLAGGEQEAGINLLQRLADEASSPLWRKMAQETIAVQNI